MDYEKVFDLLVLIGGANEDNRFEFIYAHTREKTVCVEYRFIGKLGFGGKYYSGSNRVSYYSEDHTAKREEIKNKLNLELAKLRD